MATVLASAAPSLAQALEQIVGPGNVMSDDASRTMYSNDLSYETGAVAALIVRPNTIDELAAAVRAATSADYAVIARGGGMSYTKGYVPEKADSVIFDLRGLNRIIEINADDMYVTVEAGVTWMQLREALAPLGLRTPYWGTISGRYATVGGTLSQNSLFHGSGVHGTVANSVTGIQVVTAEGEILTTGSWASRHAKPFTRSFGPDATGLFIGDTGAFGLKAAISLRLIPTPEHTGFLSFRFDRHDELIAAQTKIARLGIASECYGFDGRYNRIFQNSGVTFEQGLSIIGKIARKGGLKGLTQAAKVAMGGKKLLANVPYSMHVTIDAHTETVVAEHVELVADIAAAHGGSEMLNSIPTVFRNAPFGEARSAMINIEGDVWTAVHGFFPLSSAQAVTRATEDFLTAQQALMDAHGIKSRFLTCFAGTDFLIEAIFDWHDALGPMRLSLIEPEYANIWGKIPPAEKTRAIVLDFRRQVRDLYAQMGGTALQIGRYYPYLDLIDGAALPRLLNAVKAAVDPESQINPGVLGLRG
jgi:FAD/FMN-containing dehydrogenase